MEKRKHITLSFKESEYWLYDILKSYSSATAIIKDILKKHFKDKAPKNE